MDNEYNLFIIAIQNRNVQRVESYLKRIEQGKQSSILNTVNEYKEAALHVAAKVGSVEIVNLLLKYQAEVNVLDLKKQSPLHKAIIGGSGEAAKVLISAGTNLNNKDDRGRTVLLYAINNNMIFVIKELIKFGASPAKDDYLIHMAIQNHSLEVVKILHYAGVSLLEQDPFGHTPLLVACCYERFSIAEYLLKSEKEVIENYTGWLKRFGWITCGGSVSKHSAYCEILGVNCATEWWFRNCLSFVIHRGITRYDDLNRLVKLFICAGFNINDFTDLKGRWDVEILKFIVHSMSSPRSLKDLCRIRVRKLLGKKAMLNLYKLDLPKTLHTFLALEIL